MVENSLGLHEYHKTEKHSASVDNWEFLNASSPSVSENDNHEGGQIKNREREISQIKWGNGGNTFGDDEGSSSSQNISSASTQRTWSCLTIHHPPTPLRAPSPPPPRLPSNTIQIDVGGVLFKSSLKTFQKFPESRLLWMTEEALNYGKQAIFIDRNGRLFEHILNFCRTSQLLLPDDFKELKALQAEAVHYNIVPMISAIKDEFEKRGMNLHKLMNMSSIIFLVFNSK